MFAGRHRRNAAVRRWCVDAALYTRAWLPVLRSASWACLAAGVAGVGVIEPRLAAGVRGSSKRGVGAGRRRPGAGRGGTPLVGSPAGGRGGPRPGRSGQTGRRCSRSSASGRDRHLSGLHGVRTDAGSGQTRTGWGRPDWPLIGEAVQIGVDHRRGGRWSASRPRGNRGVGQACCPPSAESRPPPARRGGGDGSDPTVRTRRLRRPGKVVTSTAYAWLALVGRLGRSSAASWPDAA